MTATRARILRGLASEDTPQPTELVLRSALIHLDRVLGGESRETRAAQLEHDAVAFRILVAEMLDAHRRAGDYEGLAVFAPGALLSAMREIMPSRLRGRIVAEVAQNLIGLSEKDLPRAVAAELAAL